MKNQKDDHGFCLPGEGVEADVQNDCGEAKFRLPFSSSSRWRRPSDMSRQNAIPTVE